MDLTYSRHAIRRMIAQGISEAMVETVLLGPRWMPSTSGGVRYDGIVDERRMRVVVDADDESVIVTAFWYRQVNA